MPAEVHGASRMGGKEGLERRREGRRKKKQQHGRGGSTRSGSGSVVARLALDLERRKKKNQRAAALERDPLPFAAGSTLPQQEQGCARASSSWEGKTGDGLADEGEDRGGIGTWVGLPARGLSSKDHPRGHQVIQHPSQRQLRSSGRGFRARQARGERGDARLDACDGHIRVLGAGVCLDGEADGEIGRVLLRGGAPGAHHRPEARRHIPPPRRREPRGVVEAAAEPRDRRAGVRGAGGPVPHR
ncbi:uncharacterized protein LOC123407713 isoform X4 [Hordeum vulgare subsp. vulgare]|uniref:uncharacterized protein LOC123407713 isoform X4 n=1 Tax=Hordeum vulgare subsp. vulgare TaxID=112509 RepID=UPI001D1A507D|nr:uncharacterized protein LOC123407713 isoform X4 [Hordeum vulgare subsp. vulgare]